MDKAHRSMRKPPLYTWYKQFTHGGSNWQDQYLLSYWDQCVQPVVYRKEVYHGYKLLRRLGNWCWLTQDPHTRDYLTVKFLPRERNHELEMCTFIRKHCHSPFVSTIKDQFSFPHRLSRFSYHTFKDITFDAIVYPTTGSSFGRISSEFENVDSPDLPLSMQQREEYIRQVICGMAELHSIGVVHGDLHPGNVVLAQPTREHIERVLSKPPLEHEILRIDGSQTPLHLPQRVSEPEDISFSPGDIKIMDFGFSFRPTDGEFYSSTIFPSGTPKPPELLRDKKTNKPFKADSWYLGQLIYFILTDGSPIFSRPLIGLGDNLIEDYNHSLTELEEGQDAVINKLPVNIRRRFTPLILALLNRDPDKRTSIKDLGQNKGIVGIEPSKAVTG